MPWTVLRVQLIIHVKLEVVVEANVFQFQQAMAFPVREIPILVMQEFVQTRPVLTIQILNIPLARMVKVNVKIMSAL